MRVLLVEDHPAMRFGVRTLLELEGDVEVVGEVEDAEEAGRAAREKEPDLAIVDLQLRGRTGGVELCRELKALPSPPKVLVYTAHNKKDLASLALLSGADGFVHKGLDFRSLPEVVRRVRDGERVWLLGVEEGEADAHLRTISDEPSLTSKEKEVLQLILRGCSNAEIAAELRVSLSTVKTHVTHILRKTNRSSRRELG